MLNASYMPGTVQRVLFTLTHLILTRTLWSKGYYLLFSFYKSENLRIKRLSNLFEVLAYEENSHAKLAWFLFVQCTVLMRKQRWWIRALLWTYYIFISWKETIVLHDILVNKEGKGKEKAHQVGSGADWTHGLGGQVKASLPRTRSY